MILLCIILLTIQQSVCMNEIELNNTTTLTTSTVLSDSDYSSTTIVYEDITTTDTTTQEVIINQSEITDEFEFSSTPGIKGTDCDI